MSEKSTFQTFTERLEIVIMKTIVTTMDGQKRKPFNVRAMARKITAEVLSVFEESESELYDKQQAVNVG